MDWQPRRLQQWLATRLGPIEELTVIPVASGFSNNNYAIDCGGHRWLLRKPPLLTSHQSAHNVLREYRILEALQSTSVRVPKTVISCDDCSVIGAPFFIMDRVNGVVIDQRLPESYGLSAESLSVVAAEMIDTLVELHQQDWKSLGLQTIGCAEGFLDRQVERWLAQYRAGFCRDHHLPHLEEVADWLCSHRPSDQPAVIMHGDFHLGNLLFSQQPPARALALIDWELTTLGDPLLDLASALLVWPENEVVPAQQLACRYAQFSGFDLSALDYYRVLAAWKRAVILESRYRSLRNNKDLAAANPAALQHFELLIPQLLQKAWQLVSGGSTGKV